MAVGNGRATAGERGESRTTMRWPVVAASVALHNPGRRLLDHCWDSLGGAHVDVDPLASNATSTGEDDSGGTHMDPLVTRLLFWLVYTLAAVILLVSMLRIFPPPDRVFPRKRPVAGVVPWCCAGRMLGYGVIDWREGKLTPFWRYFRERHDFVSLWLGDYEFITFRMRLVHFMTDICCTMSLSMGLVDLQSGSVEGDFWMYQIWVFGALFVYQIVLGIALRVSAVGASERAMHAPGKPATRRVERNYFMMCFSFSAVSMLCAISYVHVMDEAGGCGDGFQTFLAYMYIFALYEFFGWLVLHPSLITFRWVLGRALLRLSTDADTDEETMACCWKKLPCCCCCRCAPQPSARVDLWGYAAKEPVLERGESSKGGSVLSADVENGGASPTPSYRSRHTSERDLVLEWKKNKAQTSIVVAKELLRRASRAKERARIARTETAIATAAAAEAEARAAEAKARSEEAKAAEAEARALRDALPPPRPGAPMVDPPTPQSMMATPPPSMALPPLDEAAFEVDEVHLDLPEVHLDLPGDLPPLDTEFSAVSSAMGTAGDEGSVGSRTPLREDEFQGFSLPPMPE